MVIGLVQFDPVWENKEKNMERIHSLLEQMDGKPDLLIFPELTLTGFTMRSRSFAETVDGVTADFFAQVAEDTKTGMVYGVIEQQNGEFFNSAVFLNDQGKRIGCYRKIHPFSFTGEDRFYQPGNGPVIIGFNGFTFGLSICYDLRFPELFRQYGKNRCDAIINIANWPVQRIEHWNTLLRARSIENICFVFACNRVGDDKSNHYPGNSGIFSPAGTPLLTANDEEKIFIFDIDPGQTKVVREKFPFLNDIRLI